jgi:hypothetical protein
LKENDLDMIEEIGKVAGEIWHLLNERGEGAFPFD